MALLARPGVHAAQQRATLEGNATREPGPPPASPKKARSPVAGRRPGDPGPQAQETRLWPPLGGGGEGEGPTKGKPNSLPTKGQGSEPPPLSLVPPRRGRWGEVGADLGAADLELRKEPREAGPS